MRKCFKFKYLCIILVALCASYLSLPEDSSLVYAADSPQSKKNPPKRKIKRRRSPPKSETDITTSSIPSPVGEEDEFEDNVNSESSGKPIDAVLLLDSSRSMQRNDPDRLRDQGARLFLQFLEENDRFSLIEFAGEANVLTPLSMIEDSSTQELSSILEGIQNEGNFTDFLIPLEVTFDLFENNKRPGSEKVIILLSDGHMDPDPTKGDKVKRYNELIEEMLPKLEKHKITLYTLALSEEADETELKNMANKTKGRSWYTEDVNTIHRIFSDLFLSIKKPQVLELTKDGFDIDGSTEEATFFVTRKTKEDPITVVDPVGREFVNNDFPSDWKWFKADFFDIITVKKPLPGTWYVNGGDDASGFAKLLSKLKLEYNWPSSTLDVGDSVILKARLTESGKVLDSPELKNLIFYSYKIINIETGNVYLQGKLNETKNGIFEGKINLNKEGDFKAFITVTSPTFTRQAHIPFSVTKGLISLNLVPANEFTGSVDSYEVSLHKSTDEMKNISVGLIANLSDDKSQPYVIPLKRFKISDRRYRVPLEKLKPGKNNVTAVLSALSRDQGKITAKSEELNIDISMDENIYEEGDDTDNLLSAVDLDEEVEVEPEADAAWPYGVAGIIISSLVCVFTGRYFIKLSSKEGGVVITPREPFETPEEITKKIETIKERSSDKKRPANEYEDELFSILPDYESIKKSFEAEAKVSVSTESATSNESNSNTDSSNDFQAEKSEDNSENDSEGEAENNSEDGAEPSQTDEGNDEGSEDAVKEEPGDSDTSEEEDSEDEDNKESTNDNQDDEEPEKKENAPAD